MTRSLARRWAVCFLYACYLRDEPPQALFDEWLAPEFYERLREEDELFAAQPGEAEQAYLRQVTFGVYEEQAQLDAYIQAHAVDWAVSRIPRVALAILRVCLYEILHVEDVPTSAAINEAVEIAKLYEPQEVCAFINGVLGGFVRAQAPAADEQES